MKKLYGLTAAKAIAVVLCLMSGIITVGGFLLMIIVGISFTQEGGRITKEMLTETAYHIAGQTYAANLLSEYAETPEPLHADKLEEFNMNYAVVGSSSDDFEKLDLSDESVYLYKSRNYSGYEDYMQGGRHWAYFYQDKNFLQAYRSGTTSYEHNRTNQGWNTEIEDRSLIPMKYFWVLYSVKEPLEENGDLFVQGRDAVNLFWNIYTRLLPATVISLILFLFSLAFLIAAAGHRDESEKIAVRWTDRIPFIILCAGVFALEIAGMGAGILIIKSGFGYIPAAYLALWLILVAIMMGLAMILFVMSMAVRIKSGSFWQKTMVYHLGKACKRSVRAVSENLPLFWKAAVFLLLLTMMQAFVIVRTRYNINLEESAFVIYKLIAVPAVLWMVMQFDRIARRTKAMAEKKVQSDMDTGGLRWVFREHAESINQMQDSLNHAIEESMKSERMKTALITNVSHDIKTPLTSIINYSDLISKEDPESPVIREYAEVLARQSERLKKLLQDLIEASKASTGNLELHLEDCDAAVILAQAAAEFEDRLEQKKLQLVVRQPEHRTIIRADGRYLWRIFENLLSNICKYSMEGTRVYIDVTTEQGMVLIDFRNISREPLNISGEELIERFVRGESARSTEGSGLGLSIADSLATLMSGRMSLTVDGDLFKVTLQFPEKESDGPAEGEIHAQEYEA